VTEIPTRPPLPQQQISSQKVCNFWNREFCNRMSPFYFLRLKVWKFSPKKTLGHRSLHLPWPLAKVNQCPQHTMQDGWCWDRKHFSLHSCLVANPGGKLWYTHPHASTYPVSTMCLTYLLFTYFHIQAPKLQEQNYTFSNWV
jgi:hypothetical protein